MVLYEKRKKIHVIDYYIISYQWVYYVLRSFELVYQVKLVYSSRLNVKAFSNHDSQVFGAVMEAESAIKELIFEGTCQRQSKLTDYLNKIN